MRESTVTIDGVRIPVFEEGEGEPLLLFHGYIGSHLTWRHQIAPYARHFRVITFDWPGWGSATNDPALDFSYDVEMNRVLRFLDAVSDGPVHFAGHDCGGFLGLGIAQAHPQRMRSFIVVNSRAHLSWRPRWFAILQLMHLLARMPGGMALFRALPLAAMHRFFVRKELKHGTFTDDVFEYHCGLMRSRGGSESLAAFYRRYRVASRHDLGRGLAAMRIPTLIMWGERNPFLSAAIAKDLAAKIPGAELLLYPRAHHFLPEELKERFAEDSLPFLLRNRGPAPA